MRELMEVGRTSRRQSLTQRAKSAGEHRPAVLRPEIIFMPLVLVAFLGLWELVVRLADYPTFILPPPALVLQRFQLVWADGTLFVHIGVTLSEIVSGLALGLTVALFIGYLLGKSAWLERVLAPYIVASQSVPTVAIAPLLIIWFGSGRLSKVLVCALIVFFPMLINTIVGIRSVEPDLRDLMRALRADWWQTFTKLEIPAALPILFGGLKISVTLSVIGAVVGEFVGADQGLGFLINLARGIFDTPLMFVALFTLVIIAMLLYGLVLLLEKLLLGWRA